ncbi:MAG: aminotransferase class III-fold pyridoxal phosphate-dependent enzyme [Bacteroidetes bacterium]|nr:aminotransferase class III-fold pyridoxal phosphate-dependent enzyme [Bacteroidota bacterium]
MKEFDISLECPLRLSAEKPKTIGQILYDDMPGRDEKDLVILSHVEKKYTEVSLRRLRFIVSKLLEDFTRHRIASGDTVLLLNFPGCNEMYTALFFLALATKGCRVFLPMFSETVEFSRWLEVANVKHIIMPEGEVMSLEGHDKEKDSVKAIRRIAEMEKIPVLDMLSGFSFLENSETETIPDQPFSGEVINSLQQVQPEDEALIITTSGTSGHSKLVVYTHESYWFNCMAWQQAGFYDKESLGGTGFTPMFTHTMGIRAFINALWTGSPVCLIITEWFTRKPETVRYLLLKMKPAHITGGPAVYNAFLELYRLYPELKSSLTPHFKTLVSSGAGYNPVTAQEVLDATGLVLHNAYGTTETQQAFSTLLSEQSIFSHGLLPLGNPLPGVSVGLIRSDTGQECYHLYVRSVFGHKYCIGEDEAQEYFDTGDLVTLTEDQSLLYIGRASRDYFKDNFGVKIPVPALRDYYGGLMNQILHAEFFPMFNFPGLSALLFIEEPCQPEGIITQPAVLKKYAGSIEGINNRLKSRIEPFEFYHRHICRIAVINQPPPCTRKGTISSKEINLAYGELIERLQDSRKDSAGIEITESHYLSTDKYSRYISPQIGTMLSALKMNLVFHAGKKDSIYTFIHGKETEILDLAGGYGTNLVGHSNPRITEAITSFLASGRISLNNQLSIPYYTGLLAEKLSLMVGQDTGRSFKVLFGNSGSEAVEMALHHALFEWKNRIGKLRDFQLQMYGSLTYIDVAGIWRKNEEIIRQAPVRLIALADAFHGHTTGARSGLGNQKKRTCFSNLPKVEAVFVNDRRADWQKQIKDILDESFVQLEKVVQTNGHAVIESFKVSSVIAAIAEPVIGEGGVRKVNPEVLSKLAEYEFPLIADEIQCGLGRTGHFPAFRKADYYLFGKALGGGVEKISAVLIDSQRFRFDFSENYVSTFGNGEMAALAALKTLEIIEEERVAERASRIGKFLLQELAGLRDKYPSVISDVKGEGVMLGVSFNPECGSENVVLRALFNTEKAGYLLSAWFFHKHHIRLFPTLSAPATLRVEPSAWFTEGEANRFYNALEDLCMILREKRLYDLFSFLMDDDPFDDHKGALPKIGHYKTILEEPAAGAKKVAFIAHFVNPVNELRMLEPDLCRASDTGLRILFNRMQVLMEMKPFRLIANNLFNGRIHFSFYVLPVDSAELEHLHKSGKTRRVISKIQETVNLAAKDGASVISLGGYTSILTCNGMSLAEPAGCRIITGNTLTAASGLMNLRKFLFATPGFKKPARIAVVGATGNIGQVIAEMISTQEDICSGLLLVARSAKRLTAIGKELEARKSTGIRIETSTALSGLKSADILIICANTNDPLIYPHHISKDKPVLISDLSVPSALAKETESMPNVISMPFAAYVCLPADPDAVISSYSPAGTVFCCAAEAMLLGLESCPFPLKGHLLPESLKKLSEMAEKYGLFNTQGSIKSYKVTT